MFADLYLWDNKDLICIQNCITLTCSLRYVIGNTNAGQWVLPLEQNIFAIFQVAKYEFTYTLLILLIWN